MTHNREFGVRVRVNPSTDTDVDVLMVHGLGGHELHTWEAPNGKNWTTDSEFLPVDLPNARIMTFGYNANIFDDVVSSHVFDHADGLLDGLNIKRSDCEDRPLIFVAHSLGGIVVKNALITATVRKEFKPIVDATTAIVFLGTPHHGAQLASWVGVAQNLVSWAKLHPNPTGLTRELAPFSDTLRNITNQFTDIASEFHIRSFREQKPSPIINQLIVEQGAAQMGHPSERTIPLYTTHEGLCKFETPEDSHYVVIRDHLVLLAQKGKRVLTSKVDWPNAPSEVKENLHNAGLDAVEGKQEDPLRERLDALRK